MIREQARRCIQTEDVLVQPTKSDDDSSPIDHQTNTVGSRKNFIKFSFIFKQIDSKLDGDCVPHLLACANSDAALNTF